MPLTARSRSPFNRMLQFENTDELRERGLFQELHQLVSRRMALLQERNRRGQLMEREAFDRMQEEKQIAEFALREGKISIWMEYQQQQREAQRQAQAQAFQRMFTHAQLERKLKESYEAAHAKKLADWIHNEMMRHPETLRLLENSVMHGDRHNVYVHSEVGNWAAWADGHRKQFMQLVQQHQGDFQRIKQAYNAAHAGPRPGRIRAAAGTRVRPTRTNR